MTIRETTIDDFSAARDAGHVTLIDVRNPDEFAAGHIPGAALIPLPELAGRLDEVPTDREIHVVCQSGARSAQATELLTEAGVDAVSVSGGTKAWISSGREVDPS